MTVSLVAVILMFLAPFYRKSVPGDEGGLSTIFFYIAFGTFPIGIAILLFCTCLRMPRGVLRTGVALLTCPAVWGAVRASTGPAGQFPALALALAVTLFAAFAPNPEPVRLS